MMLGVNYVIYGSSSARTTPKVSLHGSLTLEEKYCCSCSSLGDRWHFEKINWKPNFVYL